METPTDSMISGSAGDGNAPAQLPGWAVLVFFADALIFLPIFVYICYTLVTLYPTLAMIEDPLPPAYAALSLSDDAAASDDDIINNNTTTNNTNKPDVAPPLTTTSLRRIDRLLRATGGWTANFRGLGCALTIDIVSGFCGSLASSVLPRALGTLAAALATVQLHTAWTHVVVTVPSPLPFYRRLPALSKTFRATWLPVSLYWAAQELAQRSPYLLAAALGLPIWDPRSPADMPDYQRAAAPHHAVWQSLLVLVTALATAIFLVIPAQVVLVRVQASLLPADADTIVPFDRSFGGAVEPEVVTGRGYVDAATAWRTFGRDSWLRLLRLMGKVVAVSMGVYLLFLVIVVPEVLLMLKASS